MNLRIGYIYVIINHINGKYYYGKTFDIKIRWKKHMEKVLNKTNTRLYDSMNFYGYDNFSIHKIKEICCNQEIIAKELNRLERYFIKISNSQNPIFGYNMSEGGDGGDLISNHPNRKNIIQRQKNSNKGKKRSIEICKKFSCIQKEIYLNLSKEEKKRRGSIIAKSRNQRINNIGYTKKELESQKRNAKFLSDFNKSEEGKKSISKSMKGKKKKIFTKEHRKNIGLSSKGRNIPGKKILINNINYDSLHDAFRKLNIPLMTIRNRLINKNFPEWNYI